MAPIEELQQRWKTLYGQTLPQLAVTHDPVQPHWPVHVDHCFGRIIMDNAIGVTKPWMAVLKAPAWKNMTASQLEDVIELGESIATGQVNLDELNQRSLELRDKAGPAAVKTKGTKGTKRKADAGSQEQAGQTTEPTGGKTGRASKQRKTDTISSYFLRSPGAEAEKKPFESLSPVSDTKPSNTDEKDDQPDQQPPSSPPTQNDPPKNKAPKRTSPTTNATDPTTSSPLDQITKSNLTPFRKQILSLLCQVPPGSYTTYATLSSHVSATTHKTCARAVGNAMRNNPFAPSVPCHRVLAHDGRIGGFGGEWGEEGKFAEQKREMLRGEGVRFDGKGRVVGRPFDGFTWVA